MAEITVKNIEDKKVWEDFLNLHPEANFLQSWEWGDFQKNFGNVIHRIGFYDDAVLCGVILSVVEDARRGRYLTVPAGPILDWQNPEMVKVFKEEITKQAKQDNCCFVRVRPQLEANDFSKSLFKQLGFVSSPIHLHAELTSQLDLSPTEESLLANMRKATRYEIKKGITQGIVVTASQNPEDIKKFYDLQIATSQRRSLSRFLISFFMSSLRFLRRPDTRFCIAPN